MEIVSSMPLRTKALTAAKYMGKVNDDNIEQSFILLKTIILKNVLIPASKGPSCKSDKIIFRPNYIWESLTIIFFYFFQPCSLYNPSKLTISMFGINPYF